MTRRILLVEDDDDLRAVLELELSDLDFEIVAHGDVASAIRGLSEHVFSVVLTDLRLPDGTAHQIIEAVRDSDMGRPSVIVMTAFGSVPDAVEAMRRGAEDFLTKPLDLEHLGLKIKRLQEVYELRQTVDQHRRIQDSVVSESPAMKAVMQHALRVAQGDGSVLVLGESGVGKEIVARAIHDASPRSKGPFVPVNCASIPDDLVESELFGHVEGAFTGAQSQRTGLVQQANGGTLLLDEIGELPLAVQAKLLRVLQEHQVRPVGSDAWTDVDIRVVGATHVDIEEAVETGEFREDLYYRLSTFIVKVAPLRERPEDIVALASTFMEATCQRLDRSVEGFESDALEHLLNYRWPGNVRELKNAIERSVTFAESGLVRIEDLPERIRRSNTSEALDSTTAESWAQTIFDSTQLITLDELKRRYIHAVLEYYDGNKSKTADVLNIGRRTLYRYLED